MTRPIAPLLLVLLASAACAAAESAPPTAVLSVTPDKTEAAMYERVTLAVDLAAEYENPFDSRQVALDARVYPPSGKAWTVPGFLYRPHTRRREGGREVVEPSGPPAWHIRLALVEPGEHRVVVTVKDRRGTAGSAPVTVRAAPSEAAGYARRSPEDHRYLTTDAGRTLYLVGANVCWGGPLGTYRYDRWLPKYAAAGCNWWRAWLAPGWVTFSLQTRQCGYDGIDLAGAWKLDHALRLSERLGLRVQVCIDSFNILRSKERQHGAWEGSPYIKASGGPLDEPPEYFTHPEMRRAYRDRLRYIVARWGYSTAVFAWEFWNEVDIGDQYDSEAVTAWHREMARHLRSIDPWGHLVTTSFARTSGDPQVDRLPELDVVQSHDYIQRADVVPTLDRDRRDKAAARTRPHYHGEFGISHSGRFTRENDPEGVYLHNGLYASVGQEHAGTPMTWWWDSYVEPQDLYGVFAAFTRWIDGFDFVRQHPVRMEPEIAYADPAAARRPTAAPLGTDHSAWGPAEFNQPITVTVTREGKVTSDHPLPRCLHGLRNHKDLHNPVTFRLDVPEDSSVGVLVDGVSGHGGAALVMTLDGKTVLEEDFADTEKSTATMTKYDKVYRVDVPAGRHTLVVENTGKDWFYAAYVIPWRVTGPPLRAYGLAGRTRALLWVHNRHYRWDRPREPDLAPKPVPGGRVTVTLVPGTWTAERWDTVEGKVLSSEEYTVGADGRLTLDLPPVEWDAAYRFVKQ